MESINALMLSTFAAGARRCGVNLSGVLSRLGIDIDMSLNPQGRLSLATFKALFEACGRESVRGYFPLEAGLAFHFEGVPEVGAFVTSASTLRDTFKIFAWSPQLLHPALFFSMDISGAQGSLCIEVRDPLGQHNDLPCMVEMVAAVICKLERDMAPNTRVVTRYDFMHVPQKDPQVYESFFQCQVAFGQPCNRVVVNMSVIDQPLLGAFPSAHLMAERVIEEKLLAAPVQGSLSHQLTTMFKQQLSVLGWSVEDVAHKLGMHPRALQRKLKEEGQGFVALQNAVRHELACHMLRESVLDVESIACQLGFSDRRSFTSAFNKWAGMSPMQYRKQTSSGQ